MPVPVGAGGGSVRRHPVDIMEIIDLTHPLEPGMPVYPGSPAPVFFPIAQVERDGYGELRLTLTTHTGTHLDAPAHMIPGGLRLDRMAPERFVGHLHILGISTGKQRIGIEDLLPHVDAVQSAEFLLLHTGWDKFWGKEAYFRDFPVLTPDAARWLAGFHLKGVGVDAVSVDPVDDTDYPVHRILLGRDLLIIENLTGLSRIPRSGALFSCLPLRITGGDGSPVRAVSLVLP